MKAEFNSQNGGKFWREFRCHGNRNAALKYIFSSLKFILIARVNLLK